MKKSIQILLDYKGRFETKFTAKPYRSGMDKELLKRYFLENGFETEFLFFHDINFRDKSLQGKIFLYCSSEDEGGTYKTYIEDVVLGLVSAGAIVIPDFLYLKAHNNKVFMEILRDLLLNDLSAEIVSKYYGTLESLLADKTFYDGKKWVLKPAEGSMSRGVCVAGSFNELQFLSKKISKTGTSWSSVKDILRRFRHKGYVPDSRYRKKFLVQNMALGLDGDWKILIFGSKFYVLRRENRKNDFRASGGGRLSFTRDIPLGILDFAENILKKLKVPNLSLDIGFNKGRFYLFEFQSIYFGSYTLEHSDFYFAKNENIWEPVTKKSILEEEYCRSISAYINGSLYNK